MSRCGGARPDGSPTARYRIAGPFLVAGALLIAPATSRPAAGQEVAYSGSAQFSTGHYLFTTRTNSFYVFNGLEGSVGAIRFSASIPIIAQSTPWISYSGDGMLPSGGTQHGDVRDRMGSGMGRRGGDRVALTDTTSYDEVGFGDPLGRADLEILSEDRFPIAVRLGAAAKAPVADVDRGFGTGEWDYAAGASLSRRAGLTFLFTDLYYWRLGDFPDLELQDALAYGIGIGRLIGNGRIGLLGSLSGYTEIIDGVDPPVEIGLGISYRFDSGVGLSGTLGVGLSESAPDLSLGAGWRVPL